MPSSHLLADMSTCLCLQLQHEQSHYRQLMSHLATVEKEKEALGAQVGSCLCQGMEVAAFRALPVPSWQRSAPAPCAACAI